MGQPHPTTCGRTAFKPIFTHGDRSGWDNLGELRASAETHTIPIIVWSGDARLVEEKREWLREQSVLALAKPFDLDDLYECLDQALNIEHDAHS
jgi:DNA-binding response OmpR family regulator